MEEVSKVFDRHLGEAMKELYNRVHWDWFFSGSADESMSFDNLARVFGQWRSLVASTTLCQVAAMGVVLRSGGHLHCHATMVGINRHGKTLVDVGVETKKNLEDAWRRMARNSGMILPAFEERAVRYIVEDNLLYAPKVMELLPMNTKLLKKLSVKEK